MIFRWLLLMCPEGRTLLPRIPWDRSAESAQLSLLDGTWQIGDWAKILFRISRESATKGDVMNGEKEPGTDFLFALSQEFGKSVDWLLTGKEHAAKKETSGQGCGRTWM